MPPALLIMLQDVRKRYAKQLTKPDHPDAIDAVAADAAAVLERARRSTPIDLERVTHLRASGKTWTEIEGELGVTRQAIQR